MTIDAKLDKLLKINHIKQHIIIVLLDNLLKGNLMRGYSLDPHPEANYAQSHYAVIYSPRKKRDRFPATTVIIYESRQEALDAQNHHKKLYAAEVVGPAKSSEGLHLFYLINWLE